MENRDDIEERGKGMTPDYFRHTLRYGRDANRLLLERLRELPQTNQRMLLIFAHMINTEQVWLRRVRGEDTTGLEIWPELDLDQAGELIDRNWNDWTNYLDNATADDLQKSVDYRTSSGTQRKNTIGDILTHLTAHGAYHRGQIALVMREEEIEPSLTDYIAWAWGAFGV